ncbi:hypothetical protein HRK28_04620 [Rathayibacter sp. VKM Ac-2835]|uniref:hypothetical protein n=1 Tax=Rathayibacter sp. VKM Ac-2835 TaxID=2739043 RepID=UPI001565C5D8|nr:hypothetical protein [Rathayibacter sp. VKM Ac-2835]NRG40198.1 hypothetical protein [Rathayibacter sp. VKM Ac-2835]
MLSDIEVAEATVDMTEAEAAQITRKIDLRLVTVAENWEAALAYILEAIERKAHLALGYPSPGAYIADKFGSTLSRLSAETRREVSQALAEGGLSSRAIASVVNVSDRQVRKDISAGGNRVPTSTIGPDGKTYTRTRREPERMTSKEEAEKITADIKKAFFAVFDGVAGLVISAMSNRVPASEIITALVRADRESARAHAESPDEASATLLEGMRKNVFTPLMDWVLDPEFQEALRPHYEHKTFLPLTDEEQAYLLKAITDVPRRLWEEATGEGEDP